MQCWQLQPAAGSGTVKVGKTITLPTPIASHHFSMGERHATPPLVVFVEFSAERLWFWLRPGARGVVSTVDESVYFVDWLSGEHFLVGQ